MHHLCSDVQTGVGGRCVTPLPVRFRGNVAFVQATKPDIFEVEDISPPSTSLGLHRLPRNTTNGDEITVRGHSYIVRSTVVRYKLSRGRYRLDHKRLQVLGTGRYLANLYLENLMES
jgi:hypothetical protein